MPSPATVPLPKTVPAPVPAPAPTPQRTDPPPSTAPMKPFERPGVPSEDPVPQVVPCKYPTCELPGIVLPARPNVADL